MQTTVLFKTDRKLKEAAQKTAHNMGVPFSAVLNAFMREFVRSNTITFTAEGLKPTPHLARILKTGDDNLKRGDVEHFSNVNDAFADLI